jgi:hypothetical protein
MGNLNQFFRDLGRNAYGLGENVASLGSAAIAEPVAGFAAMYDPTNGAQAIREGMTYTPRTQAGQMYQQGAARTLGTIAKPAMPIIDTWQRGVDIAGGYSPVAGAMLRTVPAAIGVALGAKPALQAGRQVSEGLGAMQARMIANANAPRTLNAGYIGQRGAIGIQRPLTEFEQAHLTAQRNAALPVEKGGLGLPADNTAMDRARAMGFDVDNPVYHGTGADIEAFDPKLLKETSQYMKGVFTTDKPDIASNYGDTVYPLVQKQGYTLKDKRADRASGKKPKEVDTIRDKDKNIIVTTKPENIRSRFAAFDPFNRDSSNLLAQSAKFAPAATLGALMANEKRKDKRN